MIRTQIQLSEEQLRRVRRAAHDEGVSVAEIIRRCIDRALDEEEAGRRRRYLQAREVVGAYRDFEGRGDVSESHDAHLDDAFE
jgi:hypothetical protein